ncbi:MAG: flagellar basal body rod protein FlgC [Proteobacteria bacterium]|nr:flagellar basal body rod protein FlgC [Pseudomonadota bacterium]
MSLFHAMEIASTGLAAQRVRMNALASNLANARTTRTVDGGPYRRLDPVFRAVPAQTRFRDLLGDGAARSAYIVEVPEVRSDASPPQLVYDPRHPDADERGYVAFPNINIIEEMVNLITAARSYEANVTAVQSVKTMARAALRIGM